MTIDALRTRTCPAPPPPSPTRRVTCRTCATPTTAPPSRRSPSSATRATRSGATRPQPTPKQLQRSEPIYPDYRAGVPRGRIERPRARVRLGAAPGADGVVLRLPPGARGLPAALPQGDRDRRHREDAVRRRGRARGMVPDEPDLHLRRDAAAGSRRAAARRFRPADAQRLLPALRGRDGADAALHGRARAGRGGLHERQVRRGQAHLDGHRPRRPRLGRGLVPRLGLAPVRPDALARRARPGRTRPPRRTSTRAPPCSAPPASTPSGCRTSASRPRRGSARSARTSRGSGGGSGRRRRRGRLARREPAAAARARARRRRSCSSSRSSSCVRRGRYLDPRPAPPRRGLPPGAGGLPRRPARRDPEQRDAARAGRDRRQGLLGRRARVRGGARGRPLRPARRGARGSGGGTARAAAAVRTLRQRLSRTERVLGLVSVRSLGLTR